MEIEGLYSEEKIYSILRENDSLINVALGVNQPKDIISLEQFKTLWSSSLEEVKMDEKFSSEDKMSEAANKNEEKSIVDKKVSIGIFILMLLFGFIFAYQRKKK